MQNFESKELKESKENKEWKKWKEWKKSYLWMQPHEEVWTKCAEGWPSLRWPAVFWRKSCVQRQMLHIKEFHHRCSSRWRAPRNQWGAERNERVLRDSRHATALNNRSQFHSEKIHGHKSMFRWSWRRPNLQPHEEDKNMNMILLMMCFLSLSQIQFNCIQISIKITTTIFFKVLCFSSQANSIYCHLNVIIRDWMHSYKNKPCMQSRERITCNTNQCEGF